MHPGSDDSRLAALTATFKVLARWAPQARHDVVGACSPISLDLSLLAVKSKRAPLTADEVESFVERGKKNLKNTVEEIDTVMLLQKQDRRREIGVGEMFEKMARSTRTLFAGVDWVPPVGTDELGNDSEYDLTIAIWAVLMALLDRHGAHSQLRLIARRELDELVMDFSVSPTTGEVFGAADAGTAGGHPISLDEVHHLANHLGFTFTRRERGIELRREHAGGRAAA